MKRLSKTIELLKQARVELISSKVLTDKEQLALHEQINTVVDELEKHYQECVEILNTVETETPTPQENKNELTRNQIL
jgi:hypothetical protein